MESVPTMFSLQSPVIYMTAALVITLAAVLAGYVYTQKQQKTTQTGTGKAPLADAPAGASKTKHQTRKEPHCVKESHESKENVDLSMAAGPWPIDENDANVSDEPPVLPMPENMPEHLKKILDMGFPGCPIFRRMEKPAESEVKTTSQTQNTKRETESPAEISEEPQVFPMPENMPENLKKILDMGFPGCPIFQRMDKPQETPPDQTMGEVEDKPQVLPMPENMPEHLKKILDMGFPGCPIFQRMPKPPGGAVQQVENLGLAEPAEGFLEGAEDMEEEMPKILPIPEDAPEHIKKLLEMGFPGCPVFRRKEAPTKPVPPARPKPKAKAKVEGPDGQGDGVMTGDEETKRDRDPVEFCSHLQSEVKRTKQKLAMSKIQEEMTAEQRKNEVDVQKDQLAAIFGLMQSQEDKFGVDSLDDINTQMKLYM